jgi:succinoglycan biosynthesis transport protein ExoP
VAGTPLNGNLVQITFSAGQQQTALAGVDALKTAYERTVRDAVSSQLTALLAQIDSELSSINAQLTTAAAELAGPNPSNPPALAQQQAALVARRDTLNAKRDQVVVDAASGANGVALYLAPQSATHSSSLVSALPVIAVAAVLGLIAGVLAAYVLASRRRIFLDSAEPEALIGAPLIAEIPRFHRAHRLPAASGEPAAAAVAFRTAAFLVQTRQAEPSAREVPRRRPRTGGSRMVVFSASRGDGRSTLAANLGLALADSGVSTLLVDADPTTGGLSHLLHDHFDLVAAADPLRVSLGAAGMSLEDVTRPRGSEVRVALLRTGRERQRRLSDADRDSRLHELESGFSAVIIDAPPVSESGPSWSLVRRADSALIVVTDTTPVAEVEEVMRLLKAIDIPVFGYVFNHGRRARRTARRSETEAAPMSPPASAPGRSVSA